MKKKKFITDINIVKNIYNLQLDFLSDDVRDSILKNGDDILNSLDEELNLKADDYGSTTISWWVYETDFGDQKSMVHITRTHPDKKDKIVSIHTAEDLWDYIMKYEYSQEKEHQSGSKKEEA